jgi:hypothetical protein
MRNFTFLFVALFVFNTAAISQTKDRLPCVDKTFSIVVHIVNDSLGQPNVTHAQIQSSVDGLNLAFAPICISFSICEFKTIDNFAYDKMTSEYYPATKQNDWPEMQAQYNVKNRINIYYVADIVDKPGKAGFAALGGIGVFDQFGIVIKKSSTDARTLTHEMGHYFGLLHTFQGPTPTTQTIELADGSNCKITGDLVCDTPADPYIDPDPSGNYVDATCRFISMKKDANGHYYDPLVGNVMSYYLNCSCGFTDEQYIRMATIYLSNIGMW